jgi:hypothetical protein
MQPARTEMMENDTAKLENPDMPRCSSCSYPSSASSSESVCDGGDEEEGRVAIRAPENGDRPAATES